MVFQKRPPRLGRRLVDPTGHQVRNRSLGDLDSQFEQLAMNSRSTPQRVGLRHLKNKVTDFRADRRPPGSFASGLELPEKLEILLVPVPRKDRFKKSLRESGIYILTYIFLR